MNELIECMKKEIIWQKEYLSEPVTTIYFGGGTPSLLSKIQIEGLINTIYKHYQINNKPEVTLEANPDDITREKLSNYHQLGINRLSIGIQSFHDQFLKYLHRNHNADQAKNCIRLVADSGFSNINCDLIYGIPGSDLDLWEKDLNQMLYFKPAHISSYCLTIEEKTVFGNWFKKGKLNLFDEDSAAQQYELMIKTLTGNGYDHYEISNFSLSGYHSVHNTNYWHNKKYLGIGPGAHSFNIISRQKNIAHNHKYMNAVNQGTIPYEKEVLTHKDQINEYILTSLRTKWGCDNRFIMTNYKFDLIKRYKEYIEQLEKKNLVYLRNETIFLTDAGKLIADRVILDLFIE